MKIKNIKKIEYSEDVYNLHIEDNHNYFANDICVSNCHGLKADVVRSVAENTKKADYRLGFTGTLPDPKSERMLVECVLGPVVDRVIPDDLIKLKKISDININIIKIEYPKNLVEQLDALDYQSERDFIENCEFRNGLIVKAAKKITSEDKNMLILVQKIAHGENLISLLEKEGITASMVCGDTKIEERNKVRHATEQKGGQVIVATVGVYSTGISIKRLHAVAFAAASKAKIQTLQSIGRGLRLHESKNVLQIFDFAENLKFSQKHLKKRVKYYKDNLFKYAEKVLIKE
jgi:superfamily II DNA or RNA helicase